ncbi:MAG TPA: DUF3160 domain-containing protein, partial [Polyangiaceae bacterium]|nr:DUF3160 domain-containing protein [Polyangiaceae bacterium]
MSRSIRSTMHYFALISLCAACGSQGEPMAQGGTAGDLNDAGKPGVGGSPGAGGKPGHGGDTTVAGQATAGSGGTPFPSSGGAGTGGQATGGTTTLVTETVPAALVQALADAKAMNGATLQAAYPLSLKSKLAYDPLASAGVDLIQKSALALTNAELEKLGTNGLVISRNRAFPTFSYGYQTIYSQDLPLYVSADSILFAVHRSFDTLLSALESAYLKPELGRLLDGMRTRLSTSAIEKPLASDLDLYLTVASSLLSNRVMPPVAGADPAEIQAMYDLAKAGSGHRIVTWFGSSRDEDFSQFQPRGHYAGNVDLEAYFRAMMLLGRVDLRIVETRSDGSQEFHREQFDAAVALNQLLGADRARWTGIDGTIGAFIGERDSMTPDELAQMLSKLGASDLATTNALGDSTIIDELATGGWGAQRIASRIIIKNVEGPTLPLDRSFALFGQRYTVDSHVFVNTTFDRVPGRMMPDPLDVTFAALANDAALPLLAPQLENASYAAGLARTRALVDAHEPEYWSGSLYTSWLSALRTLSPTATELAAQPSVVGTRAFQDRILNTQLASWAELRHDTILYAKQSYTSGNTCEFPDAYVDPYPALYARLSTFAERFQQIALGLPADNAVSSLRQGIVSWSTNFETVMSYLERMAQNQRTGTPHDQELM